jgi:hypothetical protein
MDSVYIPTMRDIRAALMGGALAAATHFGENRVSDIAFWWFFSEGAYACIMLARWYTTEKTDSPSMAIRR